LSSLDPNHPYYSAVLGLLIENLDGPGIDDLRDYVKRDLLIKGVKQPETDEDRAVLDSLNQEDPQDKLIEAATQQQLAEAESLIAKSEKDYATAELNRAKAVDTVEDIGRKKIETLSNVLAR
ncbi:MAG: portal protein, partial [Candidatus Thiodiazotropha sp.]